MAYTTVTDGVDNVMASHHNELVTGLTALEAKPKYVLYGGMGNSAPADSAFYFFGQPDTQIISVAGMVTEGQSRIYIPATGIITRIDLNVRVATTLASNEAVEFYLRLNATTNTTITQVADLSAAVSYFHVTGLSIAVTEGEFFEFFMKTPAWATNPTGLYLKGQVWIE